jgi:membrane-bound serine protease (ClpP class)
MELVAILIVVGVILLALETVLPGLVAGIAGFCCLVAAVILGYQRLGAPAGHWILIGVVAGLIVGAMLWVKYFPNSVLAKPFVSQRQIGSIGNEKPELLNQHGVAVTPLRPSGVAVIQGKRVDVISEGGHVQRDTPVKVVAIEGLRVVVRPVTDSPLPT